MSHIIITTSQIEIYYDTIYQNYLWRHILHFIDDVTDHDWWWICYPRFCCQHTCFSACLPLKFYFHLHFLQLSPMCPLLNRQWRSSEDFLLLLHRYEYYLTKVKWNSTRLWNGFNSFWLNWNFKQEILQSIWHFWNKLNVKKLKNIIMLLKNFV